jgi:hypothetical protein
MRLPLSHRPLAEKPESHRRLIITERLLPIDPIIRWPRPMNVGSGSNSVAPSWSRQPLQSDAEPALRRPR